MGKVYPLHSSGMKDTRTYPIKDWDFPGDILSVGGIIGDLTKLFVNTAISPQPELALGAALCLVGVLAGRKYRTNTNLRSNLYVVGLAGSGGGKDHARKCIKRALVAAGFKDYLGGEKIASGSGLLTAMQNHPCRLFLIDEMGHFVKKVAAPNAKPHEAEIWTNLTQLFTSASETYLGAEYGDQKLRPRIDIIQPCAAVYGTTVPGTFWKALESGAMSDGSLARILLIKSRDSYPDHNLNGGGILISEDLTAALQLIVAGFGGASNMPHLFDAPPDVYEVPQTLEADATIKRISDAQLAWQRQRGEENDNAIVARYFENVLKVALIRAISDCPSNPTITQENVEWARKLVFYSINTMLREAEYNVADTENEANINKIIKVIRNKGGEATAEQIGNAVRSVKGQDRAKLLLDMVATGILNSEKRDTGGKTHTTVYRLPPGS